MIIFSYSKKAYRALHYRFCFHAKALIYEIYFRVVIPFFHKKITCDTSDFDVSLSTYGIRLQSVHKTIISASLGKMKPKNFIVWVQDLQDQLPLSKELNKLIELGLQVREGKEIYGPHNKYFNYVIAHDNLERPLILIDDDIFYRPGWISKLYGKYNDLDGKCIVSGYCTEYGFLNSEGFSNFDSWLKTKHDKPSSANFFHSGSGTVLSPQVLIEIKKLGSKFIDVCPKADDIWLNWITTIHEVQTCQVESTPPSIIFRPNSQSEALYHQNVTGGGNNKQLEATFKKENIHNLRKKLCLPDC